MSTDDPETKFSTLNPLFLQAVRDEAAKSRKAKPAGQLDVKLVSALVIKETKVEGYAVALDEDDTFDLFQRPEPTAIGEHEQAEGEIQEPQSAVAEVKAAIADKQTEIDQTQQQLDRLIKIKAIVDPEEPASGKATLNELRMKRLAIQMALMADGKKYDDKDLLAVDKQIANLSGLAAANRLTDASKNTLERMKLNAKIDELRDRIQVLNEELNGLIAGHNLRVAFKKAEDYIKALTAANAIRHELLALAELLTGDHWSINMKLGGELPIPSGFEPFDGIHPDTLATTIEAIEEAKVRIIREILP